MRKSIVLLPVLAFVLSGCVVRTYTMTKDRVDQDLSSGNKGYLQGSAPAETAERSTTRQTQVLEVEFGPKSKTAKKTAEAPAVQEAPVVQEEAVVETPAPVITEAPACEEYKVQKGDTLQKISEKFYGTTKRWHKIFEANKDKIKAPDKIRVGQTICVPTEGKIEVKETKENLK
jgi:nucleoid-associated protein YgaU